MALWCTAAESEWGVLTTPGGGLSLVRRYQMNPGNYREALLEIRSDEREGADILMVRISSSPLLLLFLGLDSRVWDVDLGFETRVRV